MSTKKVHEQWSSRTGFILAAVGSAVGLGNIWKFPYMVGESGGAAFVLIYLACVFIIGLPLLSSEWLLGRKGQQNPMNSLKSVAIDNNRSKSWAGVGLIGIVVAWLILSFYSVIGGWSLAYVFESSIGNFADINAKGSGDLFNSFLKNPYAIVAWHTLFMILVLVIVSRGVAKGLERGAKIMMPALIVLLLILVFYGAGTSGFSNAINFLFAPDWSKLTPDIILAALGHAFFTLSLGMGIMLAYGSYLDKSVNIIRSAGIVVVLDTIIALIAGIAIFPVVFSHSELTVSAGVGLIFQTLPVAFGSLPFGSLFATLFFIMLSFAALTSAISLLEPVVELLQERAKLGRKIATLVAMGSVWFLGLGSAFSVNIWSDFHLLGDRSIFDSLDYLTSKFMMPIAGFLAIVFVGWFMNKEDVRKELEMDVYDFSLWNMIVKYVAPISIGIIFIAGIFDLL